MKFLSLINQLSSFHTPSHRLLLSNPKAGEILHFSHKSRPKDIITHDMHTQTCAHTRCVEIVILNAMSNIQTRAHTHTHTHIHALIKSGPINLKIDVGNLNNNEIWHGPIKLHVLNSPFLFAFELLPRFPHISSAGVEFLHIQSQNLSKWNRNAWMWSHGL